LNKLTEFVDLKAQYAALRETINARIQKVLDHGQYILGPEVAELERRLAERSGAKHCITCASGTEALLIALMALGVKAGDEVITTPFTFAATAEMIVLLGAEPVYVDVQPDTCNIDACRVQAAITARTRAILPVSLYGQPADMDEINAVAACHGLPVIEDAAQSFGATYKERQSCNLSTIGCTSFFPSKPLGCYGDGGALFTGDDALAQAMREIRVHGQSGHYRHTRIGVGGRMDTIQCAVLLAKLERFEWELARRQEIATRYSQRLSAAKCMLPVVRPDRTSAYAQYTIRVSNRARFQETLKGHGVLTAVHYPAGLHQQPAYAQRAGGARFPVTEALAREVVSLPVHPYLGAPIQDQIATIVLKAAATA
jgi:UDP-2-acetamido-2-deoxy-ribo-hexuluronate aminotransferase